MSLPANIQKMIDAIPLFRDLGMTIEQLGEGLCRCSLPITPRLVNPYGSLHGGMTFTLADTGMGFAVASLLAPGERTTTIDISIRYLKPATGKHITAHCRVVQRGNNVAAAQAEIHNDAGERVALADGSFYLWRGGG